jgi:hypothetical protein
MVNHWYFYGFDADFGPFHIKFCGYFPYTGQIYFFSELFQDHEGRGGPAVMSAAGRGW